MKAIISKYLQREYTFTIESFTAFSLIEKESGKTVKMVSVFKSLKKIFSVEEDELLEIFDEWGHLQSLSMVVQRAMAKP